MRIVVICIGRVRAPFVDDSAHFERLLGRYTRLEIVELRESGLGASQAARATKDEGRLALDRVPADAFCVVLDRGGQPTSSEQLASMLEQRRMDGRDLCFVVGGPFGLDRAVTERADSTLSFGSQTLPHQLARVVLLEQLFRAHKILLGEPYHY
ncbi:MAG: 23S rRNA (pseudouridine(1915)-N(3))-methyltransferase RlmH [Solirubrobacterales bacterium]